MPENVLYMIKPVFVFCLLVFTLLVFSQAGHAISEDNDIITRFRKPLPELELLSKEAFYEKTTAYSGMPYNDKTLAYSLRVDKSWEKSPEKGASNFLLSNKLFSNLALFNSPPSVVGRSRLEIKAVNLEYQLTAEQWYIQYVLESGYTLEGFVVHNKKKVEALMIVMDQDISYVVRTLVHINGTRVVIAEHYVPLPLWQAGQVMQEQVLNSFTLLHLEDAIVEELSTFQFLDIAVIKYPVSWKKKSSPIRSIERMSVKFVNVREITDKHKRSETSIEGQIDISVVALSASESFIKEIELYKRKLESAGILVGDRIGRIEDMRYSDSIRFGTTESYVGIDSTSDYIDYELWFSALSTGDYIFFITLITPARNEAFPTWARNIESYRIIVERMVVNQNDFDDDDGRDVVDISDQ